ncbi:MAG: TonB-dependent receptor, partial [Acidobacteria bacterium]
MRCRTAVSIPLLLFLSLSLAKAQEEDSLQKIRDYQVRPTETTRTVNLSSQKLAEAVNAFPLQRGGVVRGSIYEYHRNDNLDARNFFDPVGEPLPEYKRNQFGASLGLLLGKKLNILGSYDGLRVNQGSTILSHIPTSAMKLGDFSDLLSGSQPVQLKDPLTGGPFPGNLIPASRIHPVAARLLPLLPDPNRRDTSRNFVNNQPLVDNRDSVTGRVDYQLNEWNKLAVRYERTRQRGLRPDPLPAFGLQDRSRGQRAVLSWNQTFSTAFIVNWELQVERKTDQQLTRSPRPTGLLSSLGIAGVQAADELEEGYPEFQLSGYRRFGDEDSPEGLGTDRYEFAGNFEYVRGAYSLQFGGSAARREINNYRSPGLRRGSFSFNGFYTGDPFADFLLGLSDSASRAAGIARRDLRRNQTRFYFEDEWKTGPQLTLNLGLAHEYNSPYRSNRDDISVFHPFAFDPPPDGTLVTLASRSPVRPDWNDWSPSVGIAYRPFDNNWLVVRGRYGLFHGSIEPSTYLDYSGRNYPFFYTESAHASIEGPGLPLSSPFNNAVPAELTVSDIDPELRSPTHHEWGLTLENQAAEHWRIAAAYEGSRGTGVLRVVAANVPVPAPGPIQSRRPLRGFGGFRLVTGGGAYSAHGVDLSAERLFANGVSLKSGLEYRRSFDDSFQEPQNPRNLRAERAPDSEPAAQLYLNFLYDLPFGANQRFNLASVSWLNALIGGWRMSGIAAAHSGYRMTVEIPGDFNNDGLTGERPDRVGPGIIPASERSIDRWFRSEDFVSSAPYSFGNSGRNILVGPGYRNLDLSLIRHIRFQGHQRLEFRLEMFNA